MDDAVAGLRYPFRSISWVKLRRDLEAVEKFHASIISPRSAVRCWRDVEQVFVYQRWRSIISLGIQGCGMAATADSLRCIEKQYLKMVDFPGRGAGRSAEKTISAMRRCSLN